jgi:hypothetical protein
VADKRFHWRDLGESIFTRETLTALLLLFTAVVMSIFSMLPVYHTHVRSNEFDLQLPFSCAIDPPNEAIGLHVVTSNLSLTSHDGKCLLHLYNMSGPHLTLLEQTSLEDNIEKTVDLQNQTPSLFLNVTNTEPLFPPPSISFRYTVWGYEYPFLLLALPATFIGLAGAAMALIGSFKIIAERASRKLRKKNESLFIDTFGFQQRSSP